MITLVNYTATSSYSALCDFGCDTPEDIANLPINNDDLRAFGLPGVAASAWSMAVVASDRSLYYKNDAKGTWDKIGGEE